MTIPQIEMIKGCSQHSELPFFVRRQAADEAYDFHRSLPEYNATTLVPLLDLASDLHIRGIYVKDESERFGLNAFKGLGASFAISKILEKPERFLDPKSGKNEIEAFVTATDGNHGKGVAWAARRAGKKAFVFMPKGSAQSRADAISDQGATVEITEYNYIDAVKHAARFAKENGYVLVQDTGFEGYEEIPNYITQGYTTMVREAIKQLEKTGAGRPTHVFIQAGVGSVAGAVAGYLAELFGEDRPLVTVVEPTEVGCLFESAKNGKLTIIDGLVETEMAGLNCGEPNVLTWSLIRDYTDFFVRCDDDITWKGMIRYADPIGSDHNIISGESGAVTLGLLEEILSNPAYNEYREMLDIDEDSVVLLFNTEGATDPVNYKKVVGRITAAD